MKKRNRFDTAQIGIINHMVEMAEELVISAYKLSASQWTQFRYDIKTLADMQPDEIIEGPLAQIIRYVGQRKQSLLGSNHYDFYKICLQDHNILDSLRNNPGMSLAPFILYIVIHELIHIVRFTKFLQNFDASPNEKLAEESRVHQKTHEILKSVRYPGIEKVLEFYANWDPPIDGMRNT